MSKKEYLVPFDIEKAKAGAKVKTANGRDVRIICYDLRGHKDAQIVALVKDKHFETEDCYLYEQNGRWMDGATTSNDLCIVEERDEQDRWLDQMGGKVKGWCLSAHSGRAITASSTGEQKVYWKSIFATEKQVAAAAATAQISQIMANDERFGGVITDEEWNNEEIYKFILHRVYDRIAPVATVGIYNFIAFHTKEQAELFLEENRDLVEQFYML